MPAGSAGAGLVLESYRNLLNRMDAAAGRASPADSAGPCGACHACCAPLALLPLEAYALLATGLLDDQPSGAASCPLLNETGCRAANARPFACRARGLAVRHLDAEGGWVTGTCGFIARGPRESAAVVPLAELVARLYHLDRRFRACLGLCQGRIEIAELCRAPDRYRALFSVPAAGLLVSRAAP